MAGLADWLEDYRNWRGRQEWEQGKGWQDFFGGDPRAQEQFEKLSGFGTDAGGLVGMIKASHGSPHAFEKFDISKMGSGEGSQAYGHGLYFGEGFDSPVAKTYAAIANRGGSTQYGLSKEGRDLRVLDSIIRVSAGQHTGGDVSALGELVKKHPGAFKDPDALLSRIGEYKDNMAPEYLYNVELRWPDAAREAADPLGEHHLLDWDAPISEQPGIIQDKFHTLKPHNVNLTISGDPYTNLEVKGHDVYNYLSDVYSDPKKASAILKSLGIPGIRYLDQASRGAGQGTRNYVMFDDALANIVSRNGVSLSDLLRR